MSHIISPRHYVERYEYTLYYEALDCPGAGYGYPCTPDGVVIQDSFHAAGVVERHQQSVSDPEWLARHRAPVIQEINMGYMQPARLRCDCGCEVLLEDPMDNDCDKCGAIYNSSGQRVRCHARDVDPADEGERWEDDY